MKEHYNLREAAHIVRYERDGKPMPLDEAEKHLLERIFQNTGPLPSCFIKTNLLTFHAEIPIQPDQDNPSWPRNQWEGKQIVPDNPPDTVLVDMHLDAKARNSEGPGKIQLKTASQTPLCEILGECEKESHIIHLYGGLPETQGSQISCFLAAPCTVAESDLVIRRENMESHISDDPAALERLKRLDPVPVQPLSIKIERQAEFGHTSFSELLDCDELTGFKIKPSGVWKDSASLLGGTALKPHPNELAAIYGEFKDHNEEGPVLAFPCTGELLYQFLVAIGYCSVDEIELIGSPEQTTETQTDLASEAAKALKKKQTEEVDAKIAEICETIRISAEAHLRSGGKERVVHHARFVTEAGMQETGKNRTRALVLVKKYINSDEAGLRFHGFKPANKPIKPTLPCFVSDDIGLK